MGHCGFFDMIMIKASSTEYKIYIDGRCYVGRLIDRFRVLQQFMLK